MDSQAARLLLVFVIVVVVVVASARVLRDNSSGSSRTCARLLSRVVVIVVVVVRRRHNHLVCRRLRGWLAVPVRRRFRVHAVGYRSRRFHFLCRGRRGRQRHLCTVVVVGVVVAKVVARRVGKRVDASLAVFDWHSGQGRIEPNRLNLPPGATVHPTLIVDNNLVYGIVLLVTVLVTQLLHRLNLVRTARCEGRARVDGSSGSSSSSSGSLDSRRGGNPRSRGRRLAVVQTLFQLQHHAILHGMDKHVVVPQGNIRPLARNPLHNEHKRLPFLC
mmetsp:Transcript_1399/g.4399  ORF Transcript_1399/g.4399 Transcript_1399/m.4399 type:complete len:274 (+) Transcript_1399:321-1142(+)